MSKDSWPFVPAQVPEIVQAEGVHLFDAAGRRILDAAGGAIVVNVGHGRQRVADAVAQATKQCTYVVPPWMTPSRRAMIEALTRDWLPPELTHIHVTSGGSEAVDASLKLALQYQAAIGEASRTKIIARDVSYHGATFTGAAISGHPARRKGFAHALPDYPTVPTPYPLRCPLGAHHPDAGAYYARALRDRIEAEGPDTVAALIAEPIAGASGGALMPPEDYWPAVRNICDEYGVLLILDEVMTGFGRTGARFAHDHWNITPDILVGGKGLAGGYAPLGGMFATRAIGEAIEAANLNVMFHTFAAHPAACAAAAEVLAILVEEDLVARAAAMGTLLNERLHDAFAEHPHVAEVRGRGLLQAIEIVSDRDNLAPYPAEDAMTNRVVNAALERGVFFYGGGTGAVRDIVCIGPPFIIEPEEIDLLVDVLLEAVNAATQP